MNFDLERPDVLMARIQHAQAVDGFKQMNKCNIHPKQIPILFTVKENEGISQRELAQMLHVKPPTIAVSVKRLSAAGLIVKEEDAKDARITHLYLTDRAKEIMESTKNTINEAAEKMLEGFSDEERNQLVDYLKRILNNLGVQELPDCTMECNNK